MIIRTAIKGGLVYGAVYGTRELGIWGSSDDTFKLFQKIQKELEPVCKTVRSAVPFELPALPNSGEVSFLANHYYNKGVKSSFRHIEMIPCYLGQGLKKVSDAVKGLDSGAKPQ